MGIGIDTPLYSLTVEEFTSIIDDRLKAALAQDNNEAPEQPVKANHRLVYGLNGIRSLFGCSHVTAQRYKDTIIKEAVRQNGRKIVVDADLALELFNKRRSDK